MLSDYAANSFDSRYFGPVRFANIVGVYEPAFGALSKYIPGYKEPTKARRLTLGTVKQGQKIGIEAFINLLPM